MWKVFGSSVSYYTGKLEAHLRYKGNAYEALPTPYDGADILWSGEVPASEFNEDNHLPFGKAINVYGKGTPP